jgi:hypothetical protein
MSWSGGTYTKGNAATGGWTGDASLGIGIEAGRHDTQDNDFATGINQCLNKDGSNAATGNLNLGGFKYTNAAASTARTDLAQVAQVQDGDYIWLGTTAGTATAQTASATPAITAYKAGQKFRAIVGSGLGSTGVTATGHTININGVGAKQIVSNDGLNSSPTAGSWIAGAVIELLYDGTYMRMMNDPSGWADWAPNLRSGTATVVTPTYPLAKFRKQGKQVTLVFNLNCGISVAGSTILADLPVACADTGVIWIATGFGAFSGGVSYIGQCYVNTSTELTIQQNLLTSTNWAVTAAPSAGTRGVLTYRGV